MAPTTDRDRAVLIASHIPGADPDRLSIKMVRDLMNSIPDERETPEQAGLYIVCRRWLGLW